MDTSGGVGRAGRDPSGVSDRNSTSRHVQWQDDLVPMKRGASLMSGRGREDDSDDSGGSESSVALAQKTLQASKRVLLHSAGFVRHHDDDLFTEHLTHGLFNTSTVRGQSTPDRPVSSRYRITSQPRPELPQPRQDSYSSSESSVSVEAEYQRTRRQHHSNMIRIRTDSIRQYTDELFDTSWAPKNLGYVFRAILVLSPCSHLRFAPRMNNLVSHCLSLYLASVSISASASTSRVIFANINEPKRLDQIAAPATPSEAVNSTFAFHRNLADGRKEPGGKLERVRIFGRHSGHLISNLTHSREEFHDREESQSCSDRADIDEDVNAYTRKEPTRDERSTSATRSRQESRHSLVVHSGEASRGRPHTLRADPLTVFSRAYVVANESTTPDDGDTQLNTSVETLYSEAHNTSITSVSTSSTTPQSRISTSTSSRSVIEESNRLRNEIDAIAREIVRGELEGDVEVRAQAETKDVGPRSPQREQFAYTAHPSNGQEHDHSRAARSPKRIVPRHTEVVVRTPQKTPGNGSTHVQDLSGTHGVSPIQLATVAATAAAIASQSPQKQITPANTARIRDAVAAAMSTQQHSTDGSLTPAAIATVAAVAAAAASAVSQSGTHAIAQSREMFSPPIYFTPGQTVHSHYRETIITHSTPSGTVQQTMASSAAGASEGYPRLTPALPSLIEHVSTTPRSSGGAQPGPEAFIPTRNPTTEVHLTLSDDTWAKYVLENSNLRAELEKQLGEKLELENLVLSLEAAMRGLENEHASLVEKTKEMEKQIEASAQAHSYATELSILNDILLADASKPSTTTSGSSYTEMVLPPNLVSTDQANIALLQRELARVQTMKDKLEKKLKETEQKLNASESRSYEAREVLKELAEKVSSVHQQQAELLKFWRTDCIEAVNRVLSDINTGAGKKIYPLVEEPQD